METLSHKDILTLNHVIGEIYSARDMESFYKALFSTVLRLVPSELCSCSDIELRPTRFVKIVANSDDHTHVTLKHLPSLNAYIHEHPMEPRFTSDSVFLTTDTSSISSFMTTAVYNEYYRHLDIETQAGLSLRLSPGKAALIGLSRNKIDFSERDRLLLTLLKPHLTGALRNVKELGQLRLEKDLLHKGAEAQRQGVVLCQQDGMVIALSETAHEMFARYFAVALSEGDTLPEALERWFETEAGLAPGGQRRLAEWVDRDAFIVEKDGKRLTIKLMNDVTSGDYMLCITERDPGGLLRNLQRYTLSPRETEVVLWLAKGKTNVEIAVILNISKRTADKHLEHIFAKLGVETRAAVVAIIRNECSVN